MRKIFLFFFFFIWMQAGFINRSFAQVGTIVDSFETHIRPYTTGVACVGNNIWITGSPLGYIYKISHAGQLLDSIADPAVRHSDYSQGIASDGTHLWVCCYTSDSLYEIDLVTKQITGVYGGMNADERVSIAYNGHDKLYFANGSNLSGSYIFDIPSHTFTSWGSSVFARGFTFINHKLYGTYATSNPDQAHIFEADTATGNFLTMDDWCVADPFGGLGMSFDGNYIWQSTINSNHLYKIFFNPALRVPDFTFENAFSIIDNPVHNELRIIGKNENISRLEIYNIVGKKLIKSEYSPGQVLDVSSLDPEIYFVKTFNNKNDLTGIKKIIVE